MIARSHLCHHAMTLTTRTALFRQLSSWHNCKIPPVQPSHDTNNLNCKISTIEFMAWLQDPTSATMPWYQLPKLHFFRQLSSWHDCKITPLPPCHDTSNPNCIISTIEFMAWLQRSHHCHHAMTPTTQTALFWHEERGWKKLKKQEEREKAGEKMVTSTEDRLRCENIGSVFYSSINGCGMGPLLVLVSPCFRKM